jgi:NAD(P)-dependent dehydrogenase (short-subunit alcohol dehydrogenase family)
MKRMTSGLFNLDQETAVVLGGTGALGGAMAEALAGAGARVAIVGRNSERGQERVRRIETAGGRASFCAADALDRASLTRAREAITAQWGTVSVLVNAAGGNRPEATLPIGGDFSRLPLADWQGVFDLNLVGGVLLPCQVFAEPMLAAGRGSIINIASMAAITPLSRVVAYSAAKAAVFNLTQFLAREWAPRGLRVNAISPGFFPAEQNRAMLFKEDGRYTERGEQIIRHTPMARFGDPRELAGAVVWLAAPHASSFVTGQNIVVDGGFSAMTI